MKYNFGRGRRACVAGPALLALVVVAAPIALFAEAGAQAGAGTERLETESSLSAQTPESVIRKWPGTSRTIARGMIDAYGRPQRFGADFLAWDDNGAWKRSVVYRDARPHFIAIRDKDYLEQTIGYRVPDDKVAALERFDKRIRVDKAHGELSARSESQKSNYLAINLAEEIITEKRSVEDARAFYRKTQELSKSGKSSAYLEGFTFQSDDDKRIVPEYVSPEFH